MGETPWRLSGQSGRSRRSGQSSVLRSSALRKSPPLPLSPFRPVRRFVPSPVRPFAHSPPGSFSSEICPQGASSFVRIQNMNTDYGFFHLFKALQSMRSDKTQAALPESRSEVEVTLPKIKYSLLGSQPVQERRCQQRALRWQQFELMNAAAAGRQPIRL